MAVFNLFGHFFSVFYVKKLILKRAPAKLGLEYTWDAENRLVAIHSNNTLIVSNAYDHASRRVLKVTPQEIRTFLYDGWNLIQETIATANSTTTNHYVWGKDLSGTLQGAGGVGGLLAAVNGSIAFLPCYDGNGNLNYLIIPLIPPAAIQGWEFYRY